MPIATHTKRHGSAIQKHLCETMWGTQEMTERLAQSPAYGSLPPEIRQPINKYMHTAPLLHVPHCNGPHTAN